MGQRPEARDAHRAGRLLPVRDQRRLPAGRSRPACASPPRDSHRRPRTRERDRRRHRADPRIQHLEIWYGQPNYGGDATLDDVKVLLGRTDLAELRHLALRNCSFANDLPDALAASPLLAQLTKLDLSLGTLTTEGADAIVRNADKLRHLETLDVSQNYLPPESLVALQKVAKYLVSGQQRDDDNPEYRYSAIGE